MATEATAVDFVVALWDVVGESEASGTLAFWDPDGASFHVPDPPRFARESLPGMYGHSSLSSFVRQLYVYGFRKVSAQPGRSVDQPGDLHHLHFHHRHFRRGHPDKLHLVTRKPRRRGPRGGPQKAGGMGMGKRNSGGQRMEFREPQADQPEQVSEGLVSEALASVAALRVEQSKWDRRLEEMSEGNEEQRRCLSSLKDQHKDQEALMANLFFLLQNVDQALDESPGEEEEESLAKRMCGAEETTEVLEALAQELRMAVPLDHPLPDELDEAVAALPPSHKNSLVKPATAPVIASAKLFQAFLGRVQTSLSALQSRLAAQSLGEPWSAGHLKKDVKVEPRSPAGHGAASSETLPAEGGGPEDPDAVVSALGKRVSEVFASYPNIADPDSLPVLGQEDLAGLTEGLMGGEEEDILWMSFDRLSAHAPPLQPGRSLSDPPPQPQSQPPQSQPLPADPPQAQPPNGRSYFNL